MPVKMTLGPRHIHATGFLQRDAECGLIEDWRRGSLPAAQAFVRSRQAEALLVSYLLTTDGGRARGLTEASFVCLFRKSKALDPDADLRLGLLAAIGRCFLRGEYEASHAVHAGHAIDSGPEKHRVETGRERMLAALGRLDDSERLVLILDEVAGLDIRDINRVLEQDDVAHTVPAGRVHRRLRQSLDVPHGVSMRQMLLEASFGRPRDDLWPRLEAPLIAIRNREKRRARMFTFGLAGAVMLVALVSMAALFGDGLINNGNSDAAVEAIAVPVVEDDLSVGQLVPVAPTPTPTPTPLPTGNVPDTLLAEIRHDANSDDSYTSVAAYNAERNELQALPGDLLWYPASNPDSTRISADGEQIVVLHSDWREDAVNYALTAIDSSTLDRRWAVKLGTFERDPNTGSGVRMTVALTSDRVYVAMMNQETPDVVTIRAFDRSDGSVRESTEIEIENGPVSFGMYFRGNVFLFVPPDETRLIVAIEAWDQNIYGAVEAFLYSIDLETYEVRGPTITSLMAESRQTFSFWSAPMTPAGDALYSVQTPEGGGPSGVAFFDLDTGEIEFIELPFMADHEANAQYPSTILSNDGQRLYILDRIRGDVAIFNLTSRRVERLFPIDTGAFGSRFGQGPGQLVYGWGHLLSLDGERLYVAASVIDQHQPPESTGVWVIDMREWKIVDFWPVTGGVNEIFTELDDGSILVWNCCYDNPAEHYFYRLTRVGMQDGAAIEEQIETPSIGEQDYYTAMSLPGLYRSQHGRAPVVGGVEPVDVDIESTLPRVVATMTSEVASGVPTTIEVRVIHPESGGILRSGTRGVRFHPDSALAIFLRSEDQPGQIIVPAIVDDGVYRAVTVVPTAGTWRVDVAVTGPDGTTSVASNAGTFEAAPTFLGTDERLYRFRVSADPEEPAVDEKTMVRLDLVDVESGAPMPEGVELAARQPALDQTLSEGMPKRIDVALAGPDGSGYRTALLYQVSPGVYEGSIELWDAGSWKATIRFQPPGGRRLEIPAGAIEVVDAP